MPGSAHPAQTGSPASKGVQAKAINNGSVQKFGEQEDRAGPRPCPVLVTDGDWVWSGILQVWPKGNLKEADYQNRSHEM